MERVVTRRKRTAAIRLRHLPFLFVLPFLLQHSQDPIPSPADVLGFEPGTDSLLADWSQIGSYLSLLAEASPRVRLDTIGRTTLGRPLLMVTLGTPESQGRLDRVRHGQALLADPRRMTRRVEDSLVGAQPAVVLIGNNIHSTEIASSQMQLTLAYRLAADPRYRTYLDSTIVLMIPSTNPDGLDTVVSWYRQYRGTRYEGGPLPWLYHPYVGHDNNRDWFMLTQVETRAITRILYHQWFPEVVWDIHQMGSSGARLFVPPFADPVNPNLDPMLVGAINLVGAAMATAVLDAGKTGVSHQQRYDLWWHGGFRTVPARHNMIGILSEAASARLASPIYIHSGSLRAPPRGVNYPAPWPGGWWRMGDIVEYELLAAEGLLRLVSSQRTAFVRRFATLGRRAVAAGTEEEPYAFLVPPHQRDRHAAALLANTLIAGGVEVLRTTAPFSAAGVRYDAGTLVIPMAQPFRAHAKDLLETQRYPGGPAAPYDVSGWTLGDQMGVTVVEVGRRFDYTADRVDSVSVPPGRVFGEGRQIVLLNQSNQESRAIAAALREGARVWVTNQAVRAAGRLVPAGAVVIEPDDPATIDLIGQLAERSGFDAWATSDLRVPESRIERVPRIGLYKPWTASMDEGWTRWVFEQHGIPFITITDSMIRVGRLRQQLDVLVLPDLSERTIVSGRSQRQIPAPYAGGIGEAGVRNVTEFVRAGGTLVALDASSDFAISALNLPVTNILRDEGAGAAGSRFSAPGSIFGVAVEPGSPIASGVPDTVAAFFANGRAFQVEAPARVVARYADDLLRSGYVRNAGRIVGAAALVEIPVGQGRVVLFGFRPQHRAQTHGTFKLLFNAVLLLAAP